MTETLLQAPPATAAAALRVCGSPGAWPAHWDGPVQAVLQAAGLQVQRHPAPPAGTAPAAGPWLVVLESPATGLAAALQAEPGTDPGTWLAQWRHAVQALMQWRGGARPRWLEWREVQARPQALCALLQGCEAESAATPPPAAPVPDALCMAVAQACAAADPAVAALWPQALARCEALGPLPDTGDLSDCAAQVDAAALHQRWAEMARNAAEAREEGELLLLQLHQVQEELEQQFLQRRDSEEKRAGLETEMAALRADHDRVRAEHEALAQQHHQQYQALQQAQQHAAALQAEAEVLRAEQAQTLAEHYLVRAERDTLAHQHHEQHQALQQARQHAAALQAEIETLRGEAQTLRAESEALRANTATLQADNQALRDSALAATEEGELLLLQLHQVQEELEQQFLQRRDLAETLAAQPQHRHLDSVLQASAAALAVTHDRDTPPHRELAFHITGLRVGEHHVAEATVRLVEHHGHPGLVFFKPADDAAPLQGWQETGCEDDRPFLLLVPDDASHEARFAALSPQDDALLPVLATWMEQHLVEHAPELLARWAHVARRLRAQLAERAPALKFSHATARPLAEEDASAESGWSFTVHDVRLGARALPWLRVHWRPGAPLRPWALLRDAQAGPPLPAWPDAALEGADTGTPDAPPNLEFVFGPAARADQRHAPWSALSPADRQFVLALMARWPDVVRQALPPGADTEALALHARQLLDESLQAQQPRHNPAGPALIGRIARRLRNGSAAGSPARAAPAAGKAR
jgi:hypothetical protein